MSLFKDGRERGCVLINTEQFKRETAGMRLEASYGYLELSVRQWLDPLNALPVEPDALRALLRATSEEWDRIWPQIEERFPVSGSGRAACRRNEAAIRPADRHG